MKRVLGFILTLILILNTVVTPGISVRAEESSWMPVRTSAMSRADRFWDFWNMTNMASVNLMRIFMSIR